MKLLLTNQSASGQHGHGDGGHGHGSLGAEGEDGVVPPLAVLLLSEWTQGSRLSEQSFKPSIFSFLPKFSLYIEQGKGLSFAWLNFVLFFTLTFWNLCNLIKTPN